MAKIAILGFGTVGSGVYEVLCRNAAGVSRRAGEPVEVKYILDPKDFSNHPAAQLDVCRQGGIAPQRLADHGYGNQPSEKAGLGMVCFPA